MRLHSTHITRKIGNINQGDRLVAVVNDQNHARSIRAADMSDREMKNIDRTTVSTLESGKTDPTRQ